MTTGPVAADGLPCPACPVRAHGATPHPCLGLHHRPVCRDVAAGLPGRAAQLVRLATGQPEPDRLTLAARADTCLWADPDSPCGCGLKPRICRKPGRPREVFRPDCLQCVAGADWNGQRG